MFGKRKKKLKFQFIAAKIIQFHLNSKQSYSRQEQVWFYELNVIIIITQQYSFY